MPERAQVTMRMEPTALRRLAVLSAKLAISRTAVVHVAIAKLAEAEGVDREPA